MAERHHLRAENRASRVKIDRVTGGFTAVSDGERLKNAHGIINVISWGALMPIGVMIARYVRPFPKADPLWFHLHRGCQTLAYVLGVVGFGLGLKLQTYEPVLLYHKHRNLQVQRRDVANLQFINTHIISPQMNFTETAARGHWPGKSREWSPATLGIASAFCSTDNIHQPPLHGVQALFGINPPSSCPKIHGLYLLVTI